MSYPLPFRKGSRVIELGGGEHPYFRPNVDISPGPTVDFTADFNQPLPIADEDFDGVFSSYSLEHVSWRNVKKFILEVFRILRPNGIAVFVVPNLYEQAKVLVEKDQWVENDLCMLFGDQDNLIRNSHLNGFSPEYAFKIFREIGFSNVIITPHPNCKTDMIIEAKKSMIEMHPELWTPEERKRAFDFKYFNGGKGPVGGYAQEGYWDYPVHLYTAQKVLEKKPESVLELGCARGYVLKRVEDKDIRVRGLEVSEHCWHTRVIEPVTLCDITQTPWPIKDKEFDLCFSNAVLEHIPENKLDAVISEINRCCIRGLHGITFQNVDDFDRTHTTLKPKEWWQTKLPKNHEIIDKEDLEKGSLPNVTDNKIKLNVGSFSIMFSHGWINIDLAPLEQWASLRNYVFRKFDVRKGLPYEVEKVDLICASHFLEHLTYVEGCHFLKECFRVLKKGGVLRLAVPDSELLYAKYKANELDFYNEVNEPCSKTSLQIEKLQSLLINNHLAIYDWSSLSKVLPEAGFQIVERSKFRASRSKEILTETIDMFPTLSLYAEAIKI